MLNSYHDAARKYAVTIVCGIEEQGSEFSRSTLYNSVLIIAPGGEIVAGPMREKAGILYCNIDPEKVAIARRTLDVAGHYSRPDVFQLHVNVRPQSPLVCDV